VTQEATTRSATTVCMGIGR